MSLLDEVKAVAVTRARNPKTTEEDIEVALAWIQGEVGFMQITKAKKIKSMSGIYVYLAIALREAFYAGKLEVKK